MLSTITDASLKIGGGSGSIAPVMSVADAIGFP
jgi:hypothetical protein